MKGKQQGIVLAAMAALTAIALGLAARQVFVLADARVVSAAVIAQEPDYPYPLTQPQEEYKRKRDEREMSAARREREAWRTLGRFLIYAEALPAGLLLCVAWLLLSGKDVNRMSNKDASRSAGDL